MTNAQLIALKAHIAANTTQISYGGQSVAINALPNGPDQNFAIAAWYNEAASPEFYVWSVDVPITDIMRNGFDWQRVDNLSVGKARIWDWMTQALSINPSQVNVRDGINACFSAAGDTNMRLAIYGHCYQSASNVEKLLATGSGVASSDQGVGPATRDFIGSVTYTDIEAARAL